MQAIQALLTRRSVRQFVPGAPITQEQLDLLLRAAMSAPTARNCRPWHFVLMRERATLDALMRAHPHAAMLAQASAAIAVCGRPEDAACGNVAYLAIDTAAAMQNLLLCAHAQGLGGVWLGMYPNADRETPVNALLGLPQGYLVMHLVALGVPAQIPDAPDRFDAARVHSERW